MDPARAFHGIPKMVENYTVAHQSLSSVLFSLGSDSHRTVIAFALPKPKRWGVIDAKREHVLQLS
jgi:hypothetical protein